MDTFPEFPVWTYCNANCLFFSRRKKLVGQHVLVCFLSYPCYWMWRLCHYILTSTVPWQSENDLTPYLEPLHSSQSFRNQVTFEKGVFGIWCRGKQSKSISKDHSEPFYQYKFLEVLTWSIKCKMGHLNIRWHEHLKMILTKFMLSLFPVLATIQTACLPLK